MFSFISKRKGKDRQSGSVSCQTQIGKLGYIPQPDHPLQSFKFKIYRSKIYIVQAPPWKLPQLTSSSLHNQNWISQRSISATPSETDMKSQETIGGFTIAFDQQSLITHQQGCVRHIITGVHDSLAILIGLLTAFPSHNQNFSPMLADYEQLFFADASRLRTTP
jgi:hypothetical protein